MIVLYPAQNVIQFSPRYPEICPEVGAPLSLKSNRRSYYIINNSAHRCSFVLKFVTLVHNGPRMP